MVYNQTTVCEDKNYERRRKDTKEKMDLTKANMWLNPCAILFSMTNCHVRSMVFGPLALESGASKSGLRDDSDDDAGFCLPVAFSTSLTQMGSSIPHGNRPSVDSNTDRPKQLNTMCVQLRGCVRYWKMVYLQDKSVHRTVTQYIQI